MAITKSNAYRFNIYCRKGKILDETIENFLKKCPDAQNFVKEVLFEKITGRKYNVMDYMDSAAIHIPNYTNKHNEETNNHSNDTIRNEKEPIVDDEAFMILSEMGINID